MVSLKWAISIVLLTGSVNALAKAKTPDCDQPTEVQQQAGSLMKVVSNLSNDGCADASKLKGLCTAVSQKWDAPKDSDYEYMFEKMVYEASCVKQGDSEEVIAKKVKSMWAKLEDPYLKCDQANFDVSYGSILKYSVAISNYNFLSMAVEDWGVNLNTVDKSDSNTVLDYIQKEIELRKGTTYEGRLKDYYKKLRKHGAKHKSEL